MSIEAVYITNYDALVSKYGNTGADKVWNAIWNSMGYNTYIVNLSYAGTMNFTSVTDPTNPKQNKTAIDAIYRQLSPNYIVIVGALDVVPFQDLQNPCFSVNDPDQYAWGDIPYACDAPYSREPANFRAPTRVVGRIPDIVGGSDPKYVIKLLKTAASAKKRPASDYRSYLGISADVWQGSTSLSLTNLFGASTKMQLSPPSGPNWSAALIGARAHYINCHGASADSFFYGQKGDNYPQAHSAAHVNGRIAAGTVATAECCYGAELYDPAITGGQSGICSTYLGSSAYGFFGSSTIAYGPSNGNGAADLITQYFMKHVLAGASLGRATLQAQQEYIQAEATGSGAVDPVALKTLAQFYLLGNPTVHPVVKPKTDSKASDAVLMKGLAKSIMSEERSRVQRRQELVRRGLAMYDSVAYCRRSKTLKPGGDVLTALKKMAKNVNMKNEELLSFSVVGGMLPKSAFGQKVPKRVFHLMHGEVGKPHHAFTPSAVIVAEEQEGKIVSVRSFDRK